MVERRSQRLIDSFDSFFGNIASKRQSSVVWGPKTCKQHFLSPLFFSHLSFLSLFLSPSLVLLFLFLLLSHQGQACCVCKPYDTFPHPSTAQSPPSSLISRKHNEGGVNKLNEDLTRCRCLLLPWRLVTPRQAAIETRCQAPDVRLRFIFFLLFFHLECR